MTAPKFAAFDDGTPCPPYWEKVVLAAYYRLLGSSQKVASSAIERNDRTIRNWETNTALWARAVTAAKERWLGEITSVARRQLLKGLKTDTGDLSLKILERLDEALAPPAHRLKHEGQVALTHQPEWQALRLTILEALVEYPEAQLALAAVLSGEPVVLKEPRGGTNGSTNGSTNGTGA